MLEFGIPIPFETLHDAKTMQMIRRHNKYNPDMPGSIEQVHPNKFLASKSFSLLKMDVFLLCHVDVIITCACVRLNRLEAC